MIFVFVVVFFHALGLLSSLHAVMSTRTSQGAIAWAVSLNTFPYLAVPAYWVLGRSKFQGYVIARRDADFKNESIVREAAETIAPFAIPESERQVSTLSL